VTRWVPLDAPGWAYGPLCIFTYYVRISH